MIWGEGGANITMCVVISAVIGPYNTTRLDAFLDELYKRFSAAREAELTNICDCIGQCGLSPLPPGYRVVYSPGLDDVLIPATRLSFPQPHYISAWRWKVYDHRPHDQMSL